MSLVNLKTGKIPCTYTGKAIPELREKLREFVKNQDNHPLYVILYGRLAVGEASLQNLVNDPIQEILRKTKIYKLNCVMVINGLIFIFTEM